jgi:thioredoxin 1
VNSGNSLNSVRLISINRISGIQPKLNFHQEGISSGLNVMGSENVLAITLANWKDILKAELPVVIEFYTLTCPYCRQLTPIFQKLSEKYAERMIFAMADASVNGEIAEGYGVMGVPTLKFFCAGRPIYEIIGLRSEEELGKEFERVLSTHRKCISTSSPIYA